MEHKKGPKIFWIHMILDPKCFGTQKFFEPKILWTNNFIGSKNFGPKIENFYLGIECGPTQSYLLYFFLIFLPKSEDLKVFQTFYFNGLRFTVYLSLKITGK